MAVENPTAANVSLWTRFFKDELGAGARSARSSDYLSRAAAAAVSGWLTVALAPRIGRMYRENAPYVNGFIEPQPELAEDAPVPEELRKEHPRLVRDANPPERRRRYERRSSARAGTSSATTSRSEMATMTL